MSPPLFLLSRKESFHARAFCLCGEVNGRRTPTFGVPRACPFYPPGVGLSLSPDHTCGRSRRTAESPGGGRPALSPPDRPPLAHPVSGARARRFAGCAAARSAAALFPPLSV